MGITSRDVARLAGVSQPTVSRALSNAPGVSPETRQRVQQAAEALNYTPMHSGRTLATRRTRRVGIVAAELANPYYPALVGPLHDELERAGYRTILITDGQQNPPDMESLFDGSVDGVLLTTSERTSRVPLELSRRGIPYVQVGREVEGVESDTAVVDNRQGSTKVAEFLVELGHRRIAAVFGPNATSTGLERARAFGDTLARLGVVLRPDQTVMGKFDYSTGYAALQQIMATDEPPTAIFCASDVLALGVLNAAHRQGVGIPEDISVVGFDDMPMAGWDLFSLTTVSANLSALATAACQMLLHRLEHPDSPFRRSVISVDLVLRTTHAPAASGSHIR